MFNIRISSVFLTQVLALNVLYVTSDRNADVCLVPTQSCGSIPPVLPESFTMKSTVVDLLGKSFTWREEYFDTHNLRAKLIVVAGGSEVHMIFDYISDEVITYYNYHPGADITVDDPIADLGCVVESMLESKLYYVMRFRHKYGLGSQSRMYSSNEVLNYGGRHQYKFSKNTSITERGLPAEIFEGCVYDEDDDKTAKTLFYWIDINNVINPSGNIKVPVRIEIDGGLYNESGSFEKQKEIHDIVWFDEKDNLPDEIFQVPPRMECDFRSRPEVEKPKFPNFFSTRLEVVRMVEDWQGRLPKINYDWQEEVWYDYNQKLVRVDYVQSEELDVSLNTGKKLAPGPVSTVFDFNTGVVHYTEKTFGKCLIAKIPDKLFLLTNRPLDKDIKELSTANELFGLEGPNMFYKGKYDARGIGTQVWSGKYNTSLLGIMKEVYREFYISDDNWHDDYDEEEDFEIPIRDTQIYDSFEDGQKAKTIYEVNFYKFKKSQPHLSSYDISGCITHYNRKYFLFYLKAGSDRDNIERNYQAFLDSLRYKIVYGADVGSPLRVQELEVEYTANNKFRVTFSLLDVPKETEDISYPNKGVDLNQAKDKLMGLFSTGVFEVRFKVEDKMITISGEPNSLKELQGLTEDFVAASNAHLKDLNSIPVMTSYLGQQYMSASEAEEKKSSGYSSGSLAGLAIGMLLIGAVIGIGAMIFYQKRKSAQNTDRQQLT